MTADREVLIVSTAVDVATDAVVSILSTRGITVLRVNTEDLPFDSSMSFDYQQSCATKMSFGGLSISPRAIWYRRLRTPEKPSAMDSGIYDFCLRENRAAFIGGLMTQQVRWMNHPVSVWQGEFKSYQLHVAQSVGLKIPPTIVSNDPVEVARACKNLGDMIIKPARSGHFWKDGEEYSVFTSALTEEDLDSLDDARWAPSIYQQRVHKDVDVRATFVGGRIFAAAIHSQTDPAAAVDWRRTEDPDLPHSVIELPELICIQLRLLMARLDLVFGCIDLVRKPDGTYVFLEVNPSGQWLWLDDQLNLGISEAVADWLTHHDR